MAKIHLLFKMAKIHLLLADIIYKKLLNLIITSHFLSCINLNPIYCIYILNYYHNTLKIRILNTFNPRKDSKGLHNYKDII